MAIIPPPGLPILPTRSLPQQTVPVGLRHHHDMFMRELARLTQQGTPATGTSMPSSVTPRLITFMPLTANTAVQLNATTSKSDTGRKKKKAGTTGSAPVRTQGKR